MGRTKASEGAVFTVLRLRPHLSKEAIKKIEDPTLGLVSNRGGAPPSESQLAYRFPLKIFIDEIARIECEWNLV